MNHPTMISRNPDGHIAILGCGNGAQALAAWFGIQGLEVRLWARNTDAVAELRNRKHIELVGAINGSTDSTMYSSSIETAVRGAAVIVIVTTADAHREIARLIAPYLGRHSAVVLCPGRTGGAFEVRAIFRGMGLSDEIPVAETQSLPFACRMEEYGVVRVIGVKIDVPVATYPSGAENIVLARIGSALPMLTPSSSVLITSLENIGAILHPLIVLLNAAAIERGTTFRFYREMMEQAANVLEKLDSERIRIGAALSVELTSVVNWISKAYANVEGETLKERMVNNPAYDSILAPSTLNCRYLTEDVPCGLVPMVNIARSVGVSTPLMESIVVLTGQLLDVNFWRKGRSLERMGLNGFGVDDFRHLSSTTHPRAPNCV